MSSTSASTPPTTTDGPSEFPPLQRAVLAGAEAAGARLVVLDNLYAYGPTGGRDLVETMQAQPTSTKAATRAAMTAELLDAHNAGRVEVAIGRASDYFGPGATQSALGGTVFGTALTGRTAQVMGNPDQPHSYSYTPDVAAALITLGTQPGATGSVWHLPVAPRPAAPGRSSTTSTGLAGHRPRSFAAGRTTLTLFGLIKPAMREYLHTLYQFTDRWVVDDSKFRDRVRRSTPPPSTRPSRPPCSGTAAPPSRRAGPAATSQARHNGRLPRPDRTYDLQSTARQARAHPPEGHLMNMQTTQRTAAAMMAGAAALAIAGFTALGSIFDYPQILKAPTAEILASYRENQTAITGWFLALVISAALLAPIGVLLGRIAGGTLGKWITGVGIAAATVQVIGLSRWVLLIPGVSDDATVPALTDERPPHLRTAALLARHHPRRNHRLRPDRDLHRAGRHRLHPQCRDHRPPAWIGYLGYVSAALIATGVVIPLGIGAPASPTSSATSPGASG